MARRAVRRQALTAGIGSDTNTVGSCLIPEPGLELWFIISE